MIKLWLGFYYIFFYVITRFKTWHNYINTLVYKDIYFLYLHYFILLKKFDNFKYLYLLFEFYKLFIYLLKFKNYKLTKILTYTYSTNMIKIKSKTNINIYKRNISKDDVLLLTGNVFAGLSKLKLTYYNQSFKWFYWLNIGVLKHFSVVLNIKKLFKVFLLFKQLVFSLGFYKFFIFAFGTKEFKAEVNSINQVYRISSLNNFYYNFFHDSCFFTDKIPYNLNVDHIMTAISKETGGRDFYIVVQEKAIASFFVQKVNSCAVGFFTYTPQKHSYNFLVPIFIENFFMKTAMYGYIFIYWNGGKKLNLVNLCYYILNFKIYKQLSIKI